MFLCKSSTSKHKKRNENLSLTPKAFFEKKNKNIIDFIPFGINTNISKNPHISSKKTVVQRLFFTENRTNYLLLLSPVLHSSARVTTNKIEPYARKLKSPLNSSNMIFPILKSVFFMLKNVKDFVQDNVNE